LGIELPGSQEQLSGSFLNTVEPWLQFPQCLIGHDTKRAQGVILRNSLLGVYIAEHIQLLLVASEHAIFLSGRVVETRGFFGSGSVSARMLPSKLAKGSTGNSL
jgi:hypothetical protein